METIKEGFAAFSGNSEKVMTILDEMVKAATPSRAFGEPVTAGDFTVIPAAEVTVSLGAGFGVGSGPAQPSNHEQSGEQCSGSGGGGGGMSGARPVASIEIGPHGVAVKPIVDFTKLGLALVTALGSMLLLLGRMARMNRK
ncbi:MAG: hypothetical protein GF344_20995 [Chitinivibrionales bacterium]|nr:hypothetical protein [Chitinivibrionales bacterium]MBD3359070.1 hypothetical protein [Chitinivibrionales bacterium]